jgi:hypothetical protein
MQRRNLGRKGFQKVFKRKETWRESNSTGEGLTGWDVLNSS